DTRFNIKQAYFTLLENARLADVNAQTVAAQRVHLQEARAFWSAGRSPESDVVKAQTNVAQALLTLSNAQNAISTARVNLNIAMGIDPRTPLRIMDVNLPPPGLPDLNALVSTAQANRPEIVQAQRVIAANQADLRSSQTNMLPAVVAAGSLGLRGNSFPGGSRNRTLGLTLQWDIFDSGLTSGLVRESRANLESTRLQLYQQQQAVTQDVTQGYLNFSNAQQQLITTDAEVANALESLRLAEGRYRAGVGIFLEVTDAQATLATAQGNRVNAAYALDIALAQLDRAVGR
ncbi:MAG: TolC family protein, partial [Armatimonadota bacterium]|nr:TolC family protein [Armatimonadota bacterium]